MPNIFRLPQKTVDVVAVVDPLTVHGAFREDFGCGVYGDYRELFSRDDIDLIVNATYSYMHIPVTMEFLERGFNVVTEKPAAIKADDFEKAMAWQKKKGVKLAVFRIRVSPPITRRLNRSLTVVSSDGSWK